MASKLESPVHPFVILFTIPLALVGVVLALYANGTTLSVVAFIGVIMLTGIVVNNAIVLVDFINQLRDAGTDTVQAIREAAHERLLPILMTVAITVLGLAARGPAGPARCRAGVNPAQSASITAQAMRAPAPPMGWV